jgi:heat shock protein HspQ
MSAKSKVSSPAAPKPATAAKRAGKAEAGPHAGKPAVAKPVAAETSPAMTGQSAGPRTKAPVKRAVAKLDAKAGPKPKTRRAVASVAPAPSANPERPQRSRARKARKARPKSSVSEARFSVGDVVRHKYYPFRGVIFDIDPVFANTDDWWQSIPEKVRPNKNQPFYHLLAENAETEYIAYVSEQNLLPDTTGVPVRHPQISEYFVEDDEGRYRPVFMTMLN